MVSRNVSLYSGLYIQDVLKESLLCLVSITDNCKCRFESVMMIDLCLRLFASFCLSWNTGSWTFLISSWVVTVVIRRGWSTLLKWIHLTNRLQYVEINEFMPNSTVISSGTPQGSHLGPLLFIIHMNKIKQYLNHYSFLGYADEFKLLLQIHHLTNYLKLQKYYHCMKSKILMWFLAVKCKQIYLCNSK